MEISAVLIFVLAGFGLFFFVVKRLLRMAVRAALLGALLFALLAGALAWWWYDPLGRATERGAPKAPARPARQR